MQDPFQALVGSGLKPEFSTQDQVAQLYIEYSAAPHPEMMEYFYEELPDYWQCACGSQNNYRQNFCGRCGVSHEWLALHCSNIYLAARIIKRRGEGFVKWFDNDDTRVASPWPQGPPVELEPLRLSRTARELASGAYRRREDPEPKPEPEDIDPFATQRYVPPVSDTDRRFTETTNDYEDAQDEEETYDAYTEDPRERVIAEREAVVRWTAERLAAERRERERAEAAELARQKEKRIREQEELEARVSEEAAQEEARQREEEEELEANEQARLEKQARERVAREKRREDARLQREEQRRRKDAEHEERRRANKEALDKELAERQAEDAKQDPEDPDILHVGWGDHLKDIFKGEYDATEMRPKSESGGKRRASEDASKKEDPEGKISVRSQGGKAMSGDVVAAIIAAILLLILLLVVIYPSRQTNNDQDSQTARPVVEEAGAVPSLLLAEGIGQWE